MFYWSKHGIHVVLTDIEESNLVSELSNSPQESLLYNFVDYRGLQNNRLKMQERMRHYLEAQLTADPEKFIQRFSFRSCYDNEAQSMFPVLLEAYGQITRRATFGRLEELSPLEEIPDTILYHSTTDVYQVTLLSRGLWPWSEPKSAGRFSFPGKTIQKVAGTPDNFFAATNRLHMKFHPDFVRISVLDDTPS